MEESDYDGSLEAFRKAMEIAKAEDNRELMIRTLIYSAEADYNYFRISEALDKCLQAQKLLHDSNDLRSMTEASFFTAVNYRDTGRYDEAWPYTSNMLESALKLRDSTWIAIACYTHENMHAYRGH